MCVKMWMYEMELRSGFLHWLSGTWEGYGGASLISPAHLHLYPTSSLSPYFTSNASSFGSCRFSSEGSRAVLDESIRGDRGNMDRG